MTKKTQVEKKQNYHSCKLKPNALKEAKKVAGKMQSGDGKIHTISEAVEAACKDYNTRN